MQLQKIVAQHRAVLLFMLFLSSTTISWGQITSAAAFGTTSEGDFELPNLVNGTFLYWSPTNNNTFLASGYNFSGGTGIASNGSGFTGNNPNAPQGQQVVFLQGNNASITRTFNVAAQYHNQQYRVLLKAALRNWGNQQKIIRIFIDNILLGEYPLSSTNYEELTSLPLVLTQGNHT